MPPRSAMLARYTKEIFIQNLKRTIDLFELRIVIPRLKDALVRCELKGR